MTKAAYLIVVAVALVVGALLDRPLRQLTGGRRRISGLVGLTGMLLFLTGFGLSEIDVRFRLLASAGLSLQIAGLVSSFGPKPPRRPGVDLWAK